MLAEGKNKIQAEVILGTRSNIAEAPPVYTLRIKFHRYVAEQLLKHRMFSCCANSSRALTVPKMNKKIEESMAMPLFWGMQQKGMQPSQEIFNQLPEESTGPWGTITYYPDPIENWKEVGNFLMQQAEAYWDSSYHQQIPNRLTHAFQMAEYIVTFTDVENFFNLRLKDPNAQSEVTELARCMKEAIDGYTLKAPRQGYHLPYITDEDLSEHGLEDCLKLSAARCAVVSYDNHRTGKPMDIDAGKRIFKHLIEDTNPHYTPLEMQLRVPTAEEYKVVTGMQEGLSLLAAKTQDEGLRKVIQRKIKQSQYFANFNFWISNRFDMESKFL